MKKWKARQLLEAAKLFFMAFIAIGFIWAELERQIYGEVQPRLVDDLISLAWSAMAWSAYCLGREHEKRLPQV